MKHFGRGFGELAQVDASIGTVLAAHQTLASGRIEIVGGLPAHDRLSDSTVHRIVELPGPDEHSETDLLILDLENHAEIFLERMIRHILLTMTTARFTGEFLANLTHQIDEGEFGWSGPRTERSTMENIPGSRTDILGIGIVLEFGEEGRRSGLIIQFSNSHRHLFEGRKILSFDNQSGDWIWGSWIRNYWLCNGSIRRQEFEIDHRGDHLGRTDDRSNDIRV